MKLLFIGDIVGPSGLDFLSKALPLLRKDEAIDVAVANAENAAGGSGITAKLYRKVLHAGVDLVTLGDHVYRKAEIIATPETEERICKPANFPPDAPGRDLALTMTREGTPLAALCLLG